MPTPKKDIFYARAELFDSEFFSESSDFGASLVPDLESTNFPPQAVPLRLDAANIYPEFYKLYFTGTRYNDNWNLLIDLILTKLNYNYSQLHTIIAIDNLLDLPFTRIDHKDALLELLSLTCSMKGDLIAANIACAAIYNKQLKLNNNAKLHSLSGQGHFARYHYENIQEFPNNAHLAYLIIDAMWHQTYIGLMNCNYQIKKELQVSESRIVFLDKDNQTSSSQKIKLLKTEIQQLNNIIFSEFEIFNKITKALVNVNHDSYFISSSLFHITENILSVYYHHLRERQITIDLQLLTKILEICKLALDSNSHSIHKNFISLQSLYVGIENSYKIMNDDNIELSAEMRCKIENIETRFKNILEKKCTDLESIEFLIQKIQMFLETLSTINSKTLSSSHIKRIEYQANYSLTLKFNLESMKKSILQQMDNHQHTAKFDMQDTLDNKELKRKYSQRITLSNRTADTQELKISQVITTNNSVKLKKKHIKKQPQAFLTTASVGKAVDQHQTYFEGDNDIRYTAPRFTDANNDDNPYSIFKSRKKNIEKSLIPTSMDYYDYSKFSQGQLGVNARTSRKFLAALWGNFKLDSIQPPVSNKKKRIDVPKTDKKTVKDKKNPPNDRHTNKKNDAFDIMSYKLEPKAKTLKTIKIKPPYLKQDMSQLEESMFAIYVDFIRANNLFSYNLIDDLTIEASKARCIDSYMSTISPLLNVFHALSAQLQNDDDRKMYQGYYKKINDAMKQQQLHLTSAGHYKNKPHDEAYAKYDGWIKNDKSEYLQIYHYLVDTQDTPFNCIETFYNIMECALEAYREFDRQPDKLKNIMINTDNLCNRYLELNPCDPGVYLYKIYINQVYCVRASAHYFDPEMIVGLKQNTNVCLENYTLFKAFEYRQDVGTSFIKANLNRALEIVEEEYQNYKQNIAKLLSEFILDDKENIAVKEESACHFPTSFEEITERWKKSSAQDANKKTPAARPQWFAHNENQQDSIYQETEKHLVEKIDDLFPNPF